MTTTSQAIGIPQDTFSLPLEERLQAILSNKGVGLQSSILAEAREVIRSKLLQKIEENKRQNAAGTSSTAGNAKNNRKTYIVVAYTSNLISCGLRETFASLAKAKAADAFISTAGGIEEDIIKCLGDTIVGDFALKGADLRLQGLNRVGNLIIPNDNYIDFETFFVPIIKQLHKKQLETDWSEGTSPSELIRLVGETLDNPSSDEFLTVADPLSPQEKERLRAEVSEHVKASSSSSSSSALSEEEKEAEISKIFEEKLKAVGLEHTRSQSLVCCCARNNIPMYCPALTDGSMGDMICFYSFNKKGFVCDPVVDYKCLIDMDFGGVDGDDTEVTHDVLVLALGAGLPRHHALHLTPATGTYSVDLAADNDNDGEGQATTERKSKTVKIERTVVQIVTGLDVDGCSSSVQLEDDLAEGLVNANDRVIRVHGDASMLLPFIVAGLK